MSDLSDIFAGLESELPEAEHRSHSDRARIEDAVAARQFIRAGKAHFTLKSLRTETRFTYRATLSDDKSCVFIGVLNGPDNNSNYKYIGRIARDVFWAGRRNPRPGDVAIDAPSVMAFAWAWHAFLRNEMPASLEFWHEGRCGRCGRRLTVPESVASGYGPECTGRILNFPSTSRGR